MSTAYESSMQPGSPHDAMIMRVMTGPATAVSGTRIAFDNHRVSSLSVDPCVAMINGACLKTDQHNFRRH